MKKILSLLILCFIVSCSEKRVVMDSVTNKGTLLVPIIYSEGKPFSGVVYDIHENGNLVYEGMFKNGNLNGTQKVWFESGQLYLEDNFIDGKKDGLQKMFFESGQLYLEENFIDGKKDGLQKMLFENGQLKNEGDFVSGKKVGLQRGFYESGEVSFTTTFDNNQNGVHKKFSKDSTWYIIGEFKNGEKSGEWKKYSNNTVSSNELVVLTTNYDNGLKNGLETELYYDVFATVGYKNQVRRETNYTDGEIDGIEKSYNSNGKLEYEKNYSNGKLHGDWIWYYNNGQMRWKRYFFLDDEWEYKSKMWKRNGTPR